MVRLWQEQNYRIGILLRPAGKNDRVIIGMSFAKLRLRLTFDALAIRRPVNQMVNRWA